MQSPRNPTVSWIFIAMLSLSLGCAQGDRGEVEAAAPADRGEAAQIPTGRFVGNVTETMDAGSYTYVSLERGGEQVWAAGPRTPVEIGEEIEVSLEMPMDGFHSESLGRTFDVVYFVNELRAAAASAAPGSADPHAGLPGFGKHTSSPAAEVDAIEPPDGGYAVAELWARRGELVGREVVVRGRVTKYNAGILDRNWVHIQDGSGDPGAGTHDLTLTTDATAAVGDLVTARGRVVIDRDFGAGYRYDVLVEEASLEVE